MADRKIIAGTLSQLKLELDFDSTAISQLQVVLFGFQDAVSINQDPCGLVPARFFLTREVFQAGRHNYRAGVNDLFEPESDFLGAESH